MPNRYSEFSHLTLCACAVTLAELTAADVIDQFRLLRCFDADVPECVGFTFPKYPTEGNDCKTCVTKVTASFEQYQFVVRLFPLEMGNVEGEVKVFVGA